MFCMQCGTKLPDEARFCMNCGANVQVLVETDESEINSVLMDHNIVEDQFELGGNKIRFNEMVQQNVLYRKIFIDTGFEQKQALWYYYGENIRDFNSAYTLAIPKSLTYIEEAVGAAIEILIEKNIFDFDVESFVKIFGIGDEFVRDIEILIQKYDEIEEYIDKIGQTRRIQRASRSKWEGGGFGFGGAIKGSIMAGMLNTGTGIFRGIGDSIVDARDTNKILQMKQSVFEQVDVRSILADAVYKTNQRIGYDLCCILQDHGIVDGVIPLCQEELLKRKLDNLHKKLLIESISKEEAKKIIVGWIEDNPFSCQYYTFLFSVVNADDKNISDICIYLGYAKEYEIEKIKYISQEIQRLENNLEDNNIDVVEIDNLKQISMHCDLPYIERKRLENLQYKLEKSAQINGGVLGLIDENSVNESLVNDFIEQGRYSEVWEMISSDNAYVEWKLTDYYSELVKPYVERGDFKKIEKILNVAYEQSKLNNLYARYLINKIKRDCYVKMGNKEKIIRTDEALLELAEQGQVSACATVGFLMYRGDAFFRKKEKKAFELLHYAAMKNQPMAMDWLGCLYFEGIGTDKNMQEAHKWLELAAYYGRVHAKDMLDKI